MVSRSIDGRSRVAIPFRRVVSSWRGSWLAGTAFTGAFVTIVAVFPNSALAACLGENTGSVTCDAADPATGGALTSSFGGTTVVNVNPGGQIDAGSANVTVTAPGSLTFTNSDTVFGIPNGVALRNDFGAVSYIGNAATSGVTAVSTDGAISIVNTATVGGGSITGFAAGNGSVTINSIANVGSSIAGRSAGAGDVFVSSTGAVSGMIEAGSGTGNAGVTGSGSVTSPATGISALTGGAGNATITYNGTINATDVALSASSADGNATVTGSGGVTSAASTSAVSALASGNGNSLIAWNGAVTQTGTGIGLLASAGAGSATVNVLGNVTVTSGTGVGAATLSGLATVSVAAGVTIGGGAVGIDAESTSGNINVNVGAGASVNGSLLAMEVAAAGGTSNTTIGAGANLTGGTAGILEVGGGSLSIANGAAVTATGASGIGVGVATTAAFTLFNAGSISGSKAAIYFSPGSGLNTLTLGPTSVISGLVIGSASPLQTTLFTLAPGAADTFQLGGTGAGTFDISQLSDTGQYSGFGTFNKVDGSTWTLVGTSSFAGPISVNGGTLLVDGDVTSAGSLTVNAGGTLGGNGVVGSTLVNGGALAPGDPTGVLTIRGSLTMTAASTYLVQTSGANSGQAVITGTATIAGNLLVNPLARLGQTTTYEIFNAGTLNGTFGDASVANNFARNARLSYVGNEIFLTLDPGLLSPILPGNAGVNQKNVAGGIDNALIAGANMPTGFNALFMLSGDALLNALTQISGETATGSQQTTFDAMNLFMGVMTDPFAAGRGDGAAPGAIGYAASRAPTDAFAMVTKAPPRAFESRWNVWAAGYGGSRTTDGNATLGSNGATSSVAGSAVGADYWFSPSTVAGFALAGGGTSFSVVNGGSGRSDLFQAGAFIRHTQGSAYVTAAAAYGWQDVTTDRIVSLAGIDRLHAEYNANSYSARLEGGNRYLLPWMNGVGFTLYAAVQVTAFDLPAYAENATAGAATFALNYASKTVTDTRTELGLRTDKSFAVSNAILTLRGRAAWAHDFNTDRSATATFQTLPGSTFLVSGAAQAHESALTTASAEMKWTNGWSVATTFEGEFSDVTRSYAGKGVVRYAW